MSVTSSFCFSLSNHLIPGFFGKRPKKKEDIISIQFVRRVTDCHILAILPEESCEAREGGAGGREGRRGNKRPFLFTPDHHWPFEPQENPLKVSAREDFTELMTDTEGVVFTAVALQNDCSYRHEAVQQA